MEPAERDVVLTAAEMRAWEQAAVEAGDRWRGLMERAGTGVAVIAARIADGNRAPIVVLVGPGNNGGDGLVVARELWEQGWRVTGYVWHRSPGPEDWPWHEAVARGVEVLFAHDDPDLERLRGLLRGSSLVVDGLLGSGVNRPVADDLARIIAVVNTVPHGPVLAIDLPSGVNADTGAIEGSAVRADVTAATGFLKWGHRRGAGHEHAGVVEVVTLGRT